MFYQPSVDKEIPMQWWKFPSGTCSNKRRPTRNDSEKETYQKKYLIPSKNIMSYTPTSPA